jgi:hypothetical protein
MIPNTPNLPIFDAAGLVSYWEFVILAVLVSIAGAAFALRYPRRVLVYVSAGSLAFALILVSVPNLAPPAGVSVFLGVATLVLATIGGGPAVQLVLALASHGAANNGVFGGIVVEARNSDGQGGGTREVLRGGLAIGMLERFATAGAILAGFPEAVAVLVAIKSVGRYSELDAAEARERFIIGTLVSLIWASASAGVYYLATH